MKVTTLGIDLAKSTFRLHGGDAHGKIAFQKRVTRAEVRETIVLSK
jgi:transposase